MIKDETVNLTDKLSKKHIRLTLSGEGMWERWESTDKQTWVKTHESLSMDSVTKEKETVKNRNYFNLFKLIFSKK